MNIFKDSNLKKRAYQQCTRCVMDTSATNISFDEIGYCGFCTEFSERYGSFLSEDKLSNNARLDSFLQLVRKSGRRKQYDCVVGVSGGVDSSWALVEAKRLGLRPLAVHMDNGWNSELAQNNIANLVNSLGVDLYTYVIDWEEYRSLMQAFFDADVIDIELLYDNAMAAVCYQQARRFGIKYILSGNNQSTEGMRMPKNWNWYKRDVVNIRSISKRFGNTRLKSFPVHSTLSYIIYEYIIGIRWVSFLDYLSYNKNDALNLLEHDYGYKRYPFKHYESIFTRFYQGYILPNKFGVDKRLLHLSTLVVSGQISRYDAIKALDGIPYPSHADLQNDIVYFLKKMMWSKSQLDEYIGRPGIPHDFYPSEVKRLRRLYAFCPPRLLSLLRKNFRI